MSNDPLDDFGFPISSSEAIRLSQYRDPSERLIGSTAYLEVSEPGWRHAPMAPSRKIDLDSMLADFAEQWRQQADDRQAQLDSCFSTAISINGYSIQQIGKPPFRAVAVWSAENYGAILGATLYGNRTIINGSDRGLLPIEIAVLAVAKLNAECGAPA